VASANSAATVSPFLTSISGALGLNINGRQAMELVTVFACVAAIAKTVGRLPIYVYDAKKKPLEGHELARLLKYPNPEMTGVDFKAAIAANIALHGFGIARIVRNNAGGVAQLWPVASSQVTWRRDPRDSRLKYRITNALIGGFEEVDFSKVLHFRGGVSFDGINNLSPQDNLYNTVQIARAIDTFRAAYYGNGGNSSMIIKTAEALTEAQGIELKRQISESRNSPGQSRPIMLGQGMDAVTLDKTGRDSETLATRKEQDLAICRMFGVPPHMLGIESGSASAASTEQKGKEWIQTSLGFELAAQEAVFGSLLTRAEQDAGVHLKYDEDELSSGDKAARFAAYAVGRQNGFLSVNEIREEEDYAPIPNGDVYLEPLNMGQAGDGSTGNPGTQTTRKNMQSQPRIDTSFLNAGYQASILSDQARQCMERRERTATNMERVAKHWGDAGRLKIKAEAPANELRLYGSIGESWYSDQSITLASVQTWLDTQAGDIIVKINSPGGDVFEGNGIRNALLSYGAKGHEVKIVVEALAASIATVIMTAGTTVEMASNALIMVHNAWTYTAGNAADLLKEAGVLAKIDETIVQAYHERTGIAKDELVPLLAAETWFNAEEALTSKFIDSVTGASELAAEEDVPPAPPGPPAPDPSAKITPNQQAILDRLTRKSAAWKQAA